MNTIFLDACIKKETEYTPIWFMRQAGRYLPIYNKIKGNRSVRELSMDAESVSEVVTQAAFYLGVDAAIIYADIIFLLEPLGINFDIIEDVGPIKKGKINIQELNLQKYDIKDKLYFVFEGIERTLQKLNDKIPLIGFSAAPFTLLTYILEDRPNKVFRKTRIFMLSAKDIYNKLMFFLSDLIKEYLIEQIKHGVRAIQLFDSWSGILSEKEYEMYVLPYVKYIFSSMPSNIPKIYFCENTLHLLKQIEKNGADVISIDWRYPIKIAWEITNEKMAIQGNLDPAIAAVGGEDMINEASNIISMAQDHRGHIFSLGHGVLPETNPDELKRLVSFVHEKTRKRK